MEGEELESVKFLHTIWQASLRGGIVLGHGQHIGRSHADLARTVKEAGNRTRRIAQGRYGTATRYCIVIVVEQGSTEMTSD